MISVDTSLNRIPTEVNKMIIIKHKVKDQYGWFRSFQLAFATLIVYALLCRISDWIFEFNADIWVSTLLVVLVLETVGVVRWFAQSREDNQEYCLYEAYHLTKMSICKDVIVILMGFVHEPKLVLPLMLVIIVNWIVYLNITNPILDELDLPRI
ncbi:hypothetical protein GR7B_00045 [Vibrio phage vB_VcorM_GR7B]|nr:hypothetical protein GR7B_00045 [Vibrio phage vB_VcorM_GR7B]